MPNDLNRKQLLSSLISCTDGVRAEQIVNNLQRDHGLRTRLLDDDPMNWSPVNVGRDNKRKIFERVFNAADAVFMLELERRKRLGLPSLRSIRQASEEVLGIENGRPINVSDNYLNPYQHGGEENIQIAFFDGSGAENPTVAFRDLGIGLRPSEFSSSICKIHGSNKINLACTHGCHGHGGAITFGPCSMTVIASRLQPELLKDGEKDQVAVTAVWYVHTAPEEHKQGYYVYLVDKNNEVPTLPVSEAFETHFYKFYSRIDKKSSVKDDDTSVDNPLLDEEVVLEETPLGWRVSGSDMCEFRPGTLVTHLNYNMGHSTSNLLSLFRNEPKSCAETNMGDMCFVCWMYDFRTAKTKGAKNPAWSRRRRPILGSYARLMRNYNMGDNHHNKRVFWQRKLNTNFEYTGNHTEQTIMETVEVSWFLLKTKREMGSLSREIPLDTYLEKDVRVLYTYDGKTYETDTSSFFSTAGCRFPFLTDTLVVFVVLDNISPELRRELLNTDRDGLKEGSAFKRLKAAVQRDLGRDELLHQINSDRMVTENYSSGFSEEVLKGLQEKVAYALQMLNLSNLEDVSVPQSKKKERLIPERGVPSQLIVSGKEPLRLIPGKKIHIRLASDSPDGWLTNHGSTVEARAYFNGESPFEDQTFLDFQGGWATLVAQVKKDFPRGQSGQIFLEMRAGGRTISKTVDAIIVERSEQRKESGGNSHRDRTQNTLEVMPIPVTQEEWEAKDPVWDERELLRFRVSEKAIHSYVNVDHPTVRRLRRGFHKKFRNQINHRLVVALTVHSAVTYAQEEQVMRARGSDILRFTDTPELVEGYVQGWFAAQFNWKKTMEDQFQLELDQQESLQEEDPVAPHTKMRLVSSDGKAEDILDL